MSESTSTRPSRRVSLLVVAAVVAVLAVAAGTFAVASTGDLGYFDAGYADPAPSEASAEHDRATWHTVEFDVAENGTRFVFDEAPVDDEDMPAHGNAFITEGYIFEPGTLGDDDGVLADGSVDPAFADKVIGTWTCHGYFVGDGVRTAPDDGAWVVTTQIYRFDDGDTFVSVGDENPVGGPAADRAITGGTAGYRLARGEVSQESFGFNASEGVNARFTAEIAVE